MAKAPSRNDVLACHAVHLVDDWMGQVQNSEVQIFPPVAHARAEPVAQALSANSLEMLARLSGPKRARASRPHTANVCINTPAFVPYGNFQEAEEEEAGSEISFVSDDGDDEHDPGHHPGDC